MCSNVLQWSRASKSKQWHAMIGMTSDAVIEYQCLVLVTCRRLMTMTCCNEDVSGRC